MIPIHPGESLSLWIEGVELAVYPALVKDIEVDVCIIGGGIAGLTSAWLLLEEGKSVCVLEDFEIGSGQTGRTTAHFTTALDQRYFTLEKYHGLRGAKLAAESHALAIQKVKEIIHQESIQCDLERVDGFLFTYPGDVTNEIRRELDACHRAGLKDVYPLAKAPLPFQAGAALCFPNQLQLHPFRYIQGLAQAISKNGGQIYTHSHVEEVQGGKRAQVKLRNGHIVRCKSVIVATNTPINDRFSLHTKQASYRSYVIGLRIPKGTVPKGLYWDTEDPYHFLRVFKDEHLSTHDILLVGGEDHKTGQNDEPQNCYTELEKWARKRFPNADRVLYRWSGQIVEPFDGLAYIGKNPLDDDNVYVITGHSGNGMTYSTLAGMLLTDLIMGRKNEWQELYRPNRVSLRATPTYLRENANTAAQYMDWFRESQFSDLANLDPGEGIVYREGIHLLAAYKDEGGKVEKHSAICPHLGGIVRWNTAEKSWDCPCHGSRFDCHGKVMEGPANSDLKVIDTSKEEPMPEIPPEPTKDEELRRTKNL